MADLLIQFFQMLTGNVPGIEASKLDTTELGGAMKVLGASENNFDLEAS